MLKFLLIVFCFTFNYIQSESIANNTQFETYGDVNHTMERNTYNENETVRNESLSEAIIRQFNLDVSSSISREDFKLYSKKMLNPDGAKDETELYLYDNITHILAEKAPSSIPVKDLNHYIDNDKIMGVVEEYITKYYGTSLNDLDKDPGKADL